MRHVRIIYLPLGIFTTPDYVRVYALPPDAEIKLFAFYLIIVTFRDEA